MVSNGDINCFELIDTLLSNQIVDKMDFYPIFKLIDIIKNTFANGVCKFNKPAIFGEFNSVRKILGMLFHTVYGKCHTLTLKR